MLEGKRPSSTSDWHWKGETIQFCISRFEQARYGLYKGPYPLSFPLFFIFVTEKCFRAFREKRFHESLLVRLSPCCFEGKFQRSQFLSSFFVEVPFHCKDFFFWAFFCSNGFTFCFFVFIGFASSLEDLGDILRIFGNFLAFWLKWCILASVGDSGVHSWGFWSYKKGGRQC